VGKVNLKPLFPNSWTPFLFPECVQAMDDTALPVEENRKLTFRAALTISTPYHIRSILNEKARRWFTDSQILKYEAM
jgi:hypothetical protein